MHTCIKALTRLNEHFQFSKSSQVDAKQWQTLFWHTCGCWDFRLAPNPPDMSVYSRTPPYLNSPLCKYLLMVSFIQTLWEPDAAFDRWTELLTSVLLQLNFMFSSPATSVEYFLNSPINDSLINCLVRKLGTLKLPTAQGDVVTWDSMRIKKRQNSIKSIDTCKLSSLRTWYSYKRIWKMQQTTFLSTNLSQFDLLKLTLGHIKF